MIAVGGARRGGSDPPPEDASDADESKVDDEGDPLSRLLELEPGPPPLTLLIVAHPDDEVLGAGSLLARNARSTWIVHVTDGAPRDLADASALGFATAAEYAEARRKEVLAALAVAGFPSVRALELGVPDQGASRTLVPLTKRVAQLLVDLGPELILTHAYEGGHPDHDATAFAVHHAAAAVARARSGSAAPPQVAEFAGYHQEGGTRQVGTFLPHAGTPVITRVLNPIQRSEKRVMIACFATQQHTIGGFGTEVERFRVAPTYDFTSPPHEPPLGYDAFPWGVRSSEWLDLACAARAELATEGT